MFRTTMAEYVRPVILTAVVACLVLAGAGTAVAGDWQGKIMDKEGVKHIVNPIQPMEAPVTIQLEENWRLGGDTDAEDEFFGVISRVTTDKAGNIYLLDSQLNEVKVYSANGEYLNTLGREGEGPGEFRRPQDMFFLPDGNLGILQLAPGRIIQMTTDGEPLDDYPLAAKEGGDTPILIGGQLMGDNLILVLNENKLQEGKIDITRSLAMIDSKGTEVKRLHEEVRTMEFANSIIDEKIWSTFDRRWNVADDGSVYAVTQFADYEIEVWDRNGALKHVISREYDRLPRSEEEIARVTGIFEAFTRQVPNAQIKVSDNDQDIAALYPRADGTLWVLDARGSREMPEGSLGSFDVFNREGQFVRQVTLMGEGNPQEDGYFFVGDQLYVVTGFLDAAMAAQGGGGAEDSDEEATPMAVISYQVGALEAGME